MSPLFRFSGYLVLLISLQYVAQGQPLLCGDNDVRKYGVKLSTGSDDGPALQDANDSPDTEYLYVDRPAGQVGNKLMLQSDVRLTKPLVAGYNIQVQISKGVTLTLGEQLYFRRGQLFFGEGKVKFAAGAEVTVLPEWWFNGGKSMGESLAAVSEACAVAKKCVVVMQYQGDTKQSWNLKPNIEVWSAYAAGLTGSGGSLVGVDFLQGDYSASMPYLLPTLRRFGTAAQATNVKGLEAYIPATGGVSTSVLVKGSVQDSSLVAFVQSTVGTAFAFAASALQSLYLWTFFYVDSRQPTASRGASSPSALTDFRLAPTTLRDTSAIFRAYDGANDNTDVTLVKNSDPSGRAVSDFSMAINSWGGVRPKVVPVAQAVMGAFNSLNANIRMLIPLPASMKGLGNVVNYGGANDLAFTALATSWPPAGPQIRTNQKLIVLESFAGTWASGASRDFYLNHALMSGGGQRRINLTPGPWSPGADFMLTQNPGLVVTALVDESNVAPGRLRVRLTNLSGKNVTTLKRRLEWILFVGVPGYGK